MLENYSEELKKFGIHILIGRTNKSSIVAFSNGAEKYADILCEVVSPILARRKQACVDAFEELKKKRNDEVNSKKKMSEKEKVSNSFTEAMHDAAMSADGELVNLTRGELEEIVKEIETGFKKAGLTREDRRVEASPRMSDTFDLWS